MSLQIDNEMAVTESACSREVFKRCSNLIWLPVWTQAYLS